MEILILLLYYNRPNMVVNALNSVKRLNYDNWKLAFIDDGSDYPGKAIARKILAGQLHKVDFYHTRSSKEDKIKRGGSLIGKCMNYILKKTTSEAAVMLCDDDALHHDYFDNLNKWFAEHPTKKYCYSHVIQYNPFKEEPLDYRFSKDDIVRYATEVQNRYKNRFNLTGNINPSGHVDASQVAWKTSCNKKGKVWFPYPLTANLDATFYRHLFYAYGSCPFTGFYGQYKALYDTPLFIRLRQGKMYDTVDIPKKD